jgi:carbon monoxide dehydrogenase subunit G
MELTNEFRVGVSVPEAWKVLTDVERIAPMLPGAQLQEVEGDVYRGIVKVKVGPITAQYKGQASFVERDEANGRVVLRATGRDTRGQGNASADITATMTPDADGTRVSVVTDLTVTGKVAQFGRGVLAEVSGKLIGQFVDALHDDLARSGVSGGESAGEAAGSALHPSAGATEPEAGAAGETAQPTGTVATATQGNGAGQAGAAAAVTAQGNGAGSATSGVRRIEGPEAEPVDLIAVAGGSTMKRLLPVLGVLVVLLVVWARRRRH